MSIQLYPLIHTNTSLFYTSIQYKLWNIRNENWRQHILTFYSGINIDTSTFSSDQFGEIVNS